MHGLGEATGNPFRPPTGQNVGGLPARITESPIVDLQQTAANPAALLAGLSDYVIRHMAFDRTVSDVSFIRTNGVVEVAALSYSTTGRVLIAEQEIPERYLGYLEYVGFGSIPESAMPDVTFQLAVSGELHPKWSPYPFYAPTLATPYRFTLVAEPRRKIQLYAINNSNAKIECGGVLIGFLRPIQTVKAKGG